MANSIKSRKTYTLINSVISEDNSEYLRILRQQRNPSYKIIAKNYLEIANGRQRYEAAAYGFHATNIKI